MVMWGSTFMVTKAVARELPTFTLGALRYLIAGLALTPFALWRGGLARLPRPLPLGSLTVMAVTGVWLFSLAFNNALIYGSAAQGAIIYAFLPAAVALAAYLSLGELQSRRRVLGIVLSIAGVVVVACNSSPGEDAPKPWLGTVWMLTAVGAFAFYTVIAKRLAQHDQVVVTACVMAIGTLLLLPFAAYELSAQVYAPPSPQAWFGVVFLGVIASALAFIVYGHALRELDAGLVGALGNLDPIVGVVAAIVFLNEQLHAGQIFGGVLSLVGMWLASTQASSVQPLEI
jgi:drug/metabolite transporter (DMT)-like permease